MHLPTRPAGRTRIGFGTGAAAVALGTYIAMAGSACDTTAKFRIDEVRFDPTRPFLVVSATPLQSVSAEGGLPACVAGDLVTGFRLDFILRSTEPEGSLQGNKDLQIRDGDRVSGQRVSIGDTIFANSFAFGDSGNQLQRIEAYNPANGQSFNLANLDPAALAFVNRNPRRSDPVAVAVVVDHSGSMNGRVDPDSFYEVKSNLITTTPVPEAASDPSRERYNKLGSALLWNLNPDDRAVAWFINEKGVNLACAAPELATSLVGAPLVERERFCFRSEQRRWISASPQDNPSTDAFDLLISGVGTIGSVDVREEGRSPLWTAVAHAYAFLRNEAPQDMAKHIVVLTDSPDTCDSQSSYFVPEEGCNPGDVAITSQGFQQFKATVLAEDATARIPVSFIQLQSLGYRDPDPAQQEAACITGGTYQWINALKIAKNSTQYPDAIQAAVEKVRYTIGGVWQLFVNAPGSLPQFTADAQHILLDGTVTLNPGVLPLQSQATEAFREGNPVDRRLMLRRTCSTEAECGGADDDCVQSCLSDGDVCVVNTAYAPPWNVDSEECCCGSTEPVPTCTAFNAPCCVPNGQHLVCEQP